MKKLLTALFLLLTALAAPSIATADAIDDINKVETKAVGTAPKVIAGAILIAVAGAILFAVLGGRFANLGARLAISLLAIAICYIIVVSTDVGKALNTLLNISSAKSIFQPFS